MAGKRLYSFLLIALLLAGCTQSDLKEKENLQMEIALLKDSLHHKDSILQDRIQLWSDSSKILQDSIATLYWEKLEATRHTRSSKATYWFDDYTIEEFKKLGFVNPQKEILDDLYTNTKLFQSDGILGGTMRIHSAMLIGDKLAIAEGEDGHIGIYYILEYKIGENKKIKWEILNKIDVYN